MPRLYADKRSVRPWHLAYIYIYTHNCFWFCLQSGRSVSRLRRRRRRSSRRPPRLLGKLSWAPFSLLKFVYVLVACDDEGGYALAPIMFYVLSPNAMLPCWITFFKKLLVTCLNRWYFISWAFIILVIYRTIRLLRWLSFGPVKITFKPIFGNVIPKTPEKMETLLTL